MCIKLLFNFSLFWCLNYLINLSSIFHKYVLILYFLKLFIFIKKINLFIVGYKISPAEVRVRSDPPGVLPTSDLQRHLFEPLRRPSLRNIPKFCRWINPTKHRLDSSRQTSSTQVSTMVDHLLDFVRTPTGAGLHPWLRLQEDFVRTPTGARLRAPLR